MWPMCFRAIAKALQRLPNLLIVLMWITRPEVALALIALMAVAGLVYAVVARTIS